MHKLLQNSYSGRKTRDFPLKSNCWSPNLLESSFPASDIISTFGYRPLALNFLISCLASSEHAQKRLSALIIGKNELDPKIQSNILCCVNSSLIWNFTEGGKHLALFWGGYKKLMQFSIKGGMTRFYTTNNMKKKIPKYNFFLNFGGGTFLGFNHHLKWDSDLKPL